MLNQTYIKTTSYDNHKSILVDERNSTSVSCMVTDSGISSDEEGRKILKAGTPVTGSLLERQTPFYKSTESPIGVVLHDVDVTAGTANSQIVIFGTIDMSKLGEEEEGLLTAALPGLKMIQALK